MSKAEQPVLLLILDGWGYSEATEYNAIESARTPNWDSLWHTRPHMLLSASGPDVGLPDQQMGNSEVGHMHIGAGRIVAQEFTRISGAIADGSFKRNPVCTGALAAAAGRGNAVHIMGLLSPGGVHSHESHIHAMLELAVAAGVPRVCIHAFLDGRDMPPKSAGESLALLHQKCRESGRARVASVCGRFFAMDRNGNWDRCAAAWRLIVDGEGEHEAADPLLALEDAYHRDETDEFVLPTVIVDADGHRDIVQDGDVVIFMNYRADRARQLTRAFVEPGFSGFERARVPALGNFITLTEYSADFNVDVAFPPQALHNTFGEYIAGLGMHQLRIAETEKYAHVTFFFNGGEEQVFAGEDRILVPSPDVKTYDEAPEMSAAEVTDRLVEAIDSGRYDAIVCNFANPDMVGHTGDFEATVRAIETIDQCLGRLLEATNRNGMEMLITADHGNAEQMRGVSTKMELGQPHTAHTSNLVPLVYVGRKAEPRTEGTLVDLAPTMLTLMGLPVPAEMTGEPLFRISADTPATRPGTARVAAGQ